MADNTELCLDLILCRLFAEIICGEMPDKVRALRFDAIRRLQGQLQFYKDRGFVNKLLCGIAEKRGAMILKATSQTEMERVMNPHAPHYDGAKFVPDPYSVPEEESGAKALYGAVSTIVPRRVCGGDGIMTGPAINHESQIYDVDALTCEDLRVHFRTGRNIHISGSGRNRISKYRTGVLTNIGDIDIAVWTDLMRRLIARLGETELQEQLQQWVKENCAWVHTVEQVEQYSLELHAARVFDDPTWISYTDFNRRYRPDLVLGDLQKEGDNPNR